MSTFQSSYLFYYPLLYICRYWKYFDQRLEEGPREISKLGLPSDLHDLDAAFIWEGNYRTYFFKGDDYWRYNENYKSVDAGYPKHISVWGEWLLY